MLPGMARPSLGKRQSTAAPHQSGIQLSHTESREVAVSQFPPEPRSGSLPKVWTDSEESNTDVSRSTVATALECRDAMRPTLTIMTGARAGEVITLGEAESVIIGRSHKSNLRLSENGVSRQHCQLTRKGDEYTVEDLGSTNGTRVNGKEVTSWQLVTGDRIQIGESLVLQFAMLDDAEESLAQHLYEMSTRDPLTKAYNRRYFTSRLDAELSHTRRHSGALSLMILDLDHFKQVNDVFGHGAGDALLKAVVTEIQGMIRVEDLLSRHGGEEFALLVRGATVHNAGRLAERIRARLENLVVHVGGHQVAATISIGVAEVGECQTGTQPELMTLADRRLYMAKSLGRNRVVCCDL
jgi:diguanylate cyclase (GGDEF)-like protein